MTPTPGQRMLGLGELLRHAPDTAQSDVPETAPVAPDPAAALAAERDRIFDEARKAGFAAGQAMAKAEVDRAVASATSDVEARHAAQAKALADAQARFVLLASSLEQACAAFEDRIEPAATTLAMHAVARVLGDAMADGHAVAAMCRQSLDEVRQRPLTLRVAADDRAAVAALDLADDVRIDVDAALRAGECRLETHRGLYETGLRTRLYAIADALCGGETES